MNRKWSDCKEANKGHYCKQKQDLVEEELQQRKLESTSKNNLKLKTAGSNKAQKYFQSINKAHQAI